MTEQVGGAGLVTAVDIDMSRLGHLADAGAEVREHDVLSGPVETGAFDLVHARAVLLHLPDPAQALANMAAALAPGASGRYEVIHGGTPGARFWQITSTTTLPLFVDAGVIDESTAETLIAIHDDPTFAYVPATSTVTMARRPA